MTQDQGPSGRLNGGSSPGAPPGQPAPHVLRRWGRVQAPGPPRPALGLHLGGLGLQSLPCAGQATGSVARSRPQRLRSLHTGLCASSRKEVNTNQVQCKCQTSRGTGVRGSECPGERGSGALLQRLGRGAPPPVKPQGRDSLRPCRLWSRASAQSREIPESLPLRAGLQTTPSGSAESRPRRQKLTGTK